MIDRHMTKTQMRIAAGISTNILAKMGKGESVDMDSPAKIATVLELMEAQRIVICFDVEFL